MIAVLGVLLDEFCFLSEVSLKLIWSLLGTADDWMTPFELGDKLVRSSGTNPRWAPANSSVSSERKNVKWLAHSILFYFIFLIPHGLQNLPFKFSTDWRGFNIILAVLLARPRVFSLIISCTDWKLMVNVRHALLPNNSWHGKKRRFDRRRGSYY